MGSHQPHPSIPSHFTRGIILLQQHAVLVFFELCNAAIPRKHESGESVPRKYIPPRYQVNMSTGALAPVSVSPPYMCRTSSSVTVQYTLSVSSRWTQHYIDRRASCQPEILHNSPHQCQHDANFATCEHEHHTTTGSITYNGASFFGSSFSLARPHCSSSSELSMLAPQLAKHVQSFRGQQNPVGAETASTFNFIFALW